MQELQKAIEKGAHEKVRDSALREFHAQVKAWDVALPKVTPVVLDFGMDDFYRYGLIEYWVCNELDAGYCAKYLFVFDRQTCPMHHHQVKSETFFMVKGKVKVAYDDRAEVLREGDTLLLTPGVKHSFTGIGPALMLEISMPCRVDDNYFANPKIPIGGNYADGALT